MAYINRKNFIADLPIISIISVVYNAEKYIEQTLLSLVNQTYKNIEIIIVDGGSTDGTLDIIKRYETGISYWISEPDKGIYDAMNKATKVVTGDWVNFVGAGDIVLNVLHKVVPKLRDNNAIYYGDVYRNDLLKVFNGKFSIFRFSRISICHQAILYPARVYNNYSYDLKYRSNSDHHLNILLYGDKQYKWKYLPVIICIYEGGGYSEVNKDYNFIKDRVNVVKQNMPFFVYVYAYSRNVIYRLLNSKTFKK
ncbi:MAG: glycosyltransferase [Sphingobacteriaceae bacterium]|nr:MAG: glycosyltransferase [Sphingobacteriaceae bacterium]